MVEVWKDVPGYEGLYQVSNLGNVRSLDRYVDYGKTTAFRKGRIMKQGKATGGYLQVELFKNKISSTRLVHRLVAEAFVTNIENLSEVNHKDENKENNCADNLEWCARKYNINYGTGNARRIKNKVVAVVMCALDGTELMEFPSVHEAARSISKNGVAGNISECCKGRRKTAYGYIWKYK